MAALYPWFIILAAGIARGYSGFGFAIIAATGLSAIYPPPLAVSTALVLDLLGGMLLARGIGPQVDKPLLKRLLLGSLLALPAALRLISVISGSGLRHFIAIMALLSGAAVILKIRIPGISRRHALAAGVGAGFVTTTASAGGPLLLIYLMNLAISPRTLRATAIVYFILSTLASLIALLCWSPQNILPTLQGLIFLPAAGAGTLVGKYLHRRFPHLSPAATTAPFLMFIAGVMLLH